MKYSKDEDFMKLAIAEAKKCKGPKRFGAIVVKNGKVVAKAHNTTYETNDPITCAEILAISRAARKLKNRKLEGCTVYETGESCLMCIAAIMKSHIKRIVVGFSHHDYNRLDGRKALNPWSRHIREIVPKDTKIRSGVLRQECMDVLFNPDYKK